MYLVLCNVTHTSMWALSQVFKLGLQGLTAPQTFISGPWGFVECHPTFVCTASCVWCVGVFVCGLCGWLDACMRACVRVPSPLLHGCVYIHMAVISLPSNASPHVSKELYTNNYQEVDDSTTTSLAVHPHPLPLRLITLSVQINTPTSLLDLYIPPGLHTKWCSPCNTLHLVLCMRCHMSAFVGCVYSCSHLAFRDRPSQRPLLQGSGEVTDHTCQ